MNRTLLFLFGLLITCCQLSTPQLAADTATPVPSQVEEPEEPPFIPIEPETSDLQERSPASVVISAEPEVVFDWTTDNCEELHIPDIAARAFRDADGMVQLWIGHFVNYRMIGPDLNSVEPDCNVLMHSAFDPDPSQFNEASWLASPYTEDGETIYAIVLTEYRGDLYSNVNPGQCPSGERYICLDTVLTLAVSTDGGESFQHIAEPPDHLVATNPSVFDDEQGVSGTRQPSNIIKGQDGYYYMFTSLLDYPERLGGFTPEEYVCLMRTANLADPTSWRFWTGVDFTGKFINPYIESYNDDTLNCAPIALPQLSGSLNESITWNTVLERYLMIGFAHHPTEAEPHWGFYYSLSVDLMHWTQRELLLELPSTSTIGDDSQQHFAYPALIDPDSPTMNFETSDDQAYLYVTRFNGDGAFHLDRDLLRYPVEITPPVFPIPEPWRFNSNGDAEGWQPLNQVVSFEATLGSLTMESTGADPSLLSPDITVPAHEYNRIGIRMKVDPGVFTVGQLFFITDIDPEITEDKSIIFDIIDDGQFHNYFLDMSTIDGWTGVIAQLRLDPVDSPDRVIEINMIGFVE